MRIIGTASTMRVAMELGQAAAGINGKVSRVVRHHSMLLQNRVKANASGRPGPRVVTGDYRRSIDRRVDRSGPATVGYVGTNEPQGRRLEFGFTGVDSLGRFFDQPPYPHFGPSFDDTVDGFLDDLGNAGADL